MDDRERDLLTMGKPVVCAACGETSYLYPKGVGHQPYILEMNCSSCHRFNLGVDAYKEDHGKLHSILNELFDRFIGDESTKSLEREITDLAEEYDGILDNRKCECGGYISISAKPKCTHCDKEIFDSFFHYVDKE